MINISDVLIKEQSSRVEKQGLLLRLRLPPRMVVGAGA